MIITSWLASTVQQFRQSGTRRKGSRKSRQRWQAGSDLQLVTAPNAEVLEDRALLATFAEAANVLNLDLAANENVAVVSNGTSYSLTLTGGTWSGTDSANVTGGGGTALTVTAAGQSVFDTINIGDAGTGTSVTFTDSGANTYGDTINVTLDDAGAGLIAFNGASPFTGAAALGAATSRNIVLNSGSSVSTVDGGITLSANSAGTATGSFHGVHLSNADVTTSGTGDIVVTGQSGDSGSFQFGVHLSSTATIGSTATGPGAGTITVDGTGGSGTFGIRGVVIANSGVTSADGNIEITGVGGTSAGGENSGIELRDGASVVSSGTTADGATVTLNGTAIAGTNTNVGVDVFNGSFVHSTTGNISVTGVGAGSSSNNIGVRLVNFGGGGGELRSMGTGVDAATITIDGTGGDGTDSNYGVYLASTGTQVSAVDGDISITGQGGNGASSSNYGVYLVSGVVVESTGTGTDAATITINGTGGDGTSSNYGVYLSSSGTQVSAVDGDISITGQGGNGTSSSNYGVYVTSGVVVESTGTGTDAATITINGTGGDGTSSNYGVYLVSTGTRVSAVDGDISITGQGGNGTSSSNRGVYIASRAVVESTGTGTDAATITINGTGGDGTSSNYGVYLSSSGTRVSAVDGDISITGQGGNGTSSSNYGVYVTSGVVVESTGTGTDAATITINGTGGDGTSSNRGVYLVSTGTRVSAVDGDISITGQGGNGTSSSNYGVYVTSGVVVESTGTGADAATITINGTGGDGTSNDFGVSLLSTGTRVSAVDGDISITGTGGGNSGHGIFLASGATIDAVDGSDTATAAILLNGTKSGSGTGIVIDSNVNSDLGTIGLTSDDDIQFLSGTINSDSGLVSLTSDDAPGDNGGGILAARVTAGSGNVILSADGDITINSIETSGTVDATSANGTLSDLNQGTTILGAFLTQDFENFGQGPTGCGGSQNLIEGWVNAAGDNLDWVSDRSGTSSSQTGPSVDHTYGDSNGTYLYIETSCSGTGYPSKQANLISPQVDLTTASNAAVQFHYHMFGSTIGTLSVQASGDDGATWSADLFSVSGNQGDQWYSQIVDLSAYDGNSQVRVRFNGLSGTSFTSDMALDDIAFFDDSATIIPAFDAIGSAVTLNGELTAAESGTSGIFGVQGTATLADNSSFTAEIGGTAAGIGHDQLYATGAVNIGTGVGLVLTPINGFVATVGDTFTIVDRSGGTGTFDGQPEGSIVTGLGPALAGQITYVGGDGDDIVLTTVSYTAPEITSITTDAATLGDKATNDTVTLTASLSGVPSGAVTIDWGDGSSPTAGSLSGSDVSGTHVYTTGGVFTVTLDVIDGSETVTDSTQAFISGVGIQDGTLNIIGSGDVDHLVIRQLNASTYRLSSTFGASGDIDAGTFGDIHVQLGPGNDRFNAVGNFGNRLIIDGGAGNDRIVGSAGGDVLLGGSGNDQIWAGSGNNILIGGTGLDYLFGGSGTDIMIGGTTSFDDDVAALRSILAEWNSGGTVAERVTNLRGGGTGLNGTNYLTDGVTVQDDGEADFIYGAGGMDWLFFDPDDDTVLGGGDLFGNDPL